MSLKAYNEKRNFKITPEPKGEIAKTDTHRFVVQEHHSSNLHFDFRLEIGGVLKSWAIRKGPSMDASVKRLAVPTEDHPVAYANFQGTIPEGAYGAGEHMIWDTGTFVLLNDDAAEAQYEKGKLKFELKGEKLKGVFNLFRLGASSQWMLVKSKDEFAIEGWMLDLLMPDKADSIPEEKTKISKPKVRTTKAKLDKKVESLVSLFRSKNLSGDHAIKSGKRVLELTSLDRVYFPDDGYTKGDLLRYYYETAKVMLPYLKDRPLIMRRFPAGISGPSFHQHDVDTAPEFVETVRVTARDGGDHFVDYVVCQNVETHLYLANLGAIERHVWHSRTSDLDRPDYFVFDLDPGKDVEFTTICETAIVVRDVIGELGLRSYPKTSGSRGIHVYVPIKPKYSYEEILGLAERIAQKVAEKTPETATVERMKAKRKPGQIYIDYLQNSRGKSIVAAYSVRPRASACVSAPLEWKEVEKKKIRIEDFTIKTMRKRLAKKGDLFAPMLKDRQSLKKALAMR
jgi:bifunctional non-homologous end joining protein LigD